MSIERKPSQQRAERTGSTGRTTPDSPAQTIFTVASLTSQQEKASQIVLRENGSTTKQQSEMGKEESTGEPPPSVSRGRGGEPPIIPPREKPIPSPEGEPERLANRWDIHQRRRNMMKLTAKGLSREQIAQELGIEIHHIRDDRKKIFRRLGVHSSEGGIVECLRRGILLPTDVLEEFNRDKLDLLSPAEQKVLDAVIEGCPQTSNEEIAKTLHLSPETIKTHWLRMFKKYEVSSRDYVIGTYFAAQIEQNPSILTKNPQKSREIPSIQADEQILLNQLIQVVTPENLQTLLSTRENREAYHRLRKHLGTSTPFETTFAGIRAHLVEKNLLKRKRAERSFEQLPPEDIALLDRFIANEGRDTTTRQVADDLGIVPKALADRVEDIRHKLRLGGQRQIHPAVLYYAQIFEQGREDFF
jgi:DNA-binding CsgD family transcriptional regulator